MDNNYHKPENAVKFAPVRLALRLATVPQAYIPIDQAAKVLGVSVDQASRWCVDRRLSAIQMGGKWWITEGDLAIFVSAATWRLVSPAPIAQEEDNASVE